MALDGERKAVLVRDIYCDGLGVCLDVCPTGALQVIEKDAGAYDEEAAVAHVTAARGSAAALAVHREPPVPEHDCVHAHGHGCPGSMARTFEPASRHHGPIQPLGPTVSGSTPSELGQWPIQLHLISPAAPYFHECDLLVAADCTAFTLGSFHADLLRGKALVIACPKLDRTEGYVEKLAELIASNTVYSLTVAIMEVPCCTGLSRIVEEAVVKSGKNIAVKTVVIGLDGRRK